MILNRFDKYLFFVYFLCTLVLSSTFVCDPTDSAVSAGAQDQLRNSDTVGRGRTRSRCTVAKKVIRQLVPHYAWRLWLNAPVTLIHGQFRWLITMTRQSDDSSGAENYNFAWLNYMHFNCKSSFRMVNLSYGSNRFRKKQIKIRT